MCVSLEAGSSSLVYSVEHSDSSDSSLLGAVTTPAHPDFLDAGIDVAVSSNRSSEHAHCPLGRVIAARFLCTTHPRAKEAEAKFPLGAYAHLGHGCATFTTHWRTDAGVCNPRHTSEPCPSNSIPTPTPAQQRYQRHEIMGVRAHARGWKRALGAPPMPSRHCPACSIRSAVWDLTYKPRPSRPHPHS